MYMDADTVLKAAFLPGALGVGIALGPAHGAGAVQRQRRRGKEPRTGMDKAPVETMKRVVWACVINGFAWVWCSYILAALDRAQIAEELSKVALAEIVVPVAVYAFKSGVEDLSKNNRWPDRGGAPGGGTEDPDGPAG